MSSIPYNISSNENILYLHWMIKMNETGRKSQNRRKCVSEPNLSLICQKHQQLTSLFCDNNMEKCDSNDEKDAEIINSSYCENSNWSPTLVNFPQKWSPQSLHDKNRKSAFQPYRQSVTPSGASTSTVLTNLQRGNTQAETLIPQTAEVNFHTKAGQGELTEQDVLKERDIDVFDLNGLTALHWGCAYGQCNTVELLMNYGADVNKLGPDEETPLILAASGGHHEVIKLLLNHGADVNHVDHLCNTALMYAAKGNHPHTCQELLLSGANFSLLNLSDDTALSIAIENNSTSAQVVLENYIVSCMENHPKKED